MKGAYSSTGLTNNKGIALRALIYLISLAWIFVFINLTPKYKTVLSAIGKNTMTVYVLHIVARYAIKGFGGSFGQDVSSYLVLISAALLSVWMFSWSSVSERYNRFVDTVYQWTVKIPLTLIRQIL